MWRTDEVICMHGLRPSHSLFANYKEKQVKLDVNGGWCMHVSFLQVYNCMHCKLGVCRALDMHVEGKF
jgi:hypothetical protein